eukprot:scaffold4912_cov55-Cyclotella_meneghiniana.AAC.4
MNHAANTNNNNTASNNNSASGNAVSANYYGLSPEQATREFDTLRREATRLERLLEDRVARYGQEKVHSYVMTLPLPNGGGSLPVVEERDGLRGKRTFEKRLHQQGGMNYKNETGGIVPDFHLFKNTRRIEH